MGYWICFAMILNGVLCDIVTSFLAMPIETWQDIYSISRDIQITGFALLAFCICEYDKIEIKAATFFLFIWRLFVTAINVFHLDFFYSPIFFVFATFLYLTWFGKAFKMGHVESGEEKKGAYYFLMPIHSVWGLLKSVFLPWEMARYETVIVIDGPNVWAVNKGKFIKKRLNFTNFKTRTGVKVYIGRPFCRYEIAMLNSLVGKRFIPVIRDCRKLRVV